MSSASGQPRDFSLRPLPASPQQPPTRPPDGHTDAATPSVVLDFPRGASSNDMVIAGAILGVLAVVFFFVRGGVRRHLIAERASLSSASSAGWAVFAFLLSLSATVVFGQFANLWNMLAFTVPMGLLILVTLVLSVILYGAAARGRR